MNIPTAKETLKSKETYDEEYPTISLSDAEEAMIEFAKLHVKAALKKASKNADLLENGEKTYSNRYIVSKGNHYSETEVDINKNSIILAYPLKNIK